MPDDASPDRFMISHLPFFQTLGALSEVDPARQPVFAGLVVLGLIDSFKEDPQRAYELEAAATAISLGDPMGDVLLRIISLLERERHLSLALGRESSYHTDAHSISKDDGSLPPMCFRRSLMLLPLRSTSTSSSKHRPRSAQQRETWATGKRRTAATRTLSISPTRPIIVHSR